MAMLLMPRGVVWVFLRVVLIGALDWLTTWLPKDSVGGVKGIWANADEPGMRRKTKRTIPPKKRLVLYRAGLELELWK
jgi:hypothetical protein